MTDYSKTLIYQIRCKDESIKEKYIGHTTNFTARIKGHYKRCNGERCKKNFKVYDFIRNNGGWDNWVCEVVLEYPCETKNKAKLKERECIEALGDLKLNQLIPTRTGKEYRNDNLEEIRCKTRTRMRIKRSNQTEEDRDKTSANQLEYRQNNPEIIKQRNIKKLEDYHANKEEINRKRREKAALKRNVNNLITEIV